MIILYILAGIVGLFFLAQFTLIWKMKRQKGKPAPSLPGAPGERIRTGERAIFYFFSPQCGACRSMTPVVEDLAKEHREVFPVDISQQFEIARKFGVMATPSMVIVEDGKIQDYLIGPQTPAYVRGLVQ